MKLLRTIRFDQSDDHVFDDSAGPDEWAVSGAFAFAHLSSGEVTGKLKQAFANGFLSLESFGRSTFAAVAEPDAGDEARLAEALAAHLRDRYGAPDIEAALPAAREELAFVADLVAEAPINTVFTVRRSHDEQDAIREEFRTVTPPSKPVHTRIWDVVDDG